MKVHTKDAAKYINPRKNRRVTASQRRGQEMVKGCLYVRYTTQETREK